jgi:hypothetical protein
MLPVDRRPEFQNSGDGVGAVHPITEIRVPISQADLADFVGATREGVAKIQAEWRGSRLGGAVTRNRAHRRSPRS